MARDGSGSQVGARSPVSPLSCSPDFRNVTISLFYCNDCTGLPLPLSLPGRPDPCPLGHFRRLTALPALQLVGSPATTPMSLPSLQVVALSGAAAEVLKLTPVFSQPPPSCPRWLGAAGVPAALSVGPVNWRPGCLLAWGGPM
ncbi:Testicular Acid Phosphatase [Manis pentadactyla]|nr:Testicular Acid Phosphatase [Manis pentadactyla]